MANIEDFRRLVAGDHGLVVVSATRTPQNPLDIEAEYADARTDRRHTVTANFVYMLPFFKDSPNRLVRVTAAGWQISGILTARTGIPLRVTQPSGITAGAAYRGDAGVPGRLTRGGSALSGRSSCGAGVA